MPMAAITTNIGKDIIQMANRLCARIGRPLELDTDGIWVCMPSTFPQEYDFKAKDGSTLSMEYPGSMLNIRTKEEFTNHQFQVRNTKLFQHLKTFF